MILTRCGQWVLLAGLLAAGAVRAEENSGQPLSAAEFEKLLRAMKPQPGEARYNEIAWYPTIWEARRKAAVEGKPLFIWAGSRGAPAAGC